MYPLSRALIEKWTQTTLVVSQCGLTITALTSALLASMLILNNLERIITKRTAYRKLSPRERLMVDGISKTQRISKASLHNVFITYSEMDSDNADPYSQEEHEFLHKLVQAEHKTIVTRQICNEQDEPLQTWKVHLLSEEAN